MNPSHPWLVVAIAAGVTLFTRALPFAVFGGKRGMPAPVKYLGGVLPAGGGAECLFQFAALAVVAALHLWRHNTLLSIFGGTAVYMLLIRLPLFWLF